jgi:hypothetical protein
MATHNYGTLVNPAHFAEIPDPADPTQPVRRSGVVLLVRNALTLADLPAITTTLLGYWAYQTTDVPSILVSGDNWATSVGPLYSREAMDAAVNQGVQNTTTLSRGAPGGVAPLDDFGLVPVTFLPVGATNVTVARGDHTHAQAWSGAPAGSYCKVDETSAGVYPTPATNRPDIVRRWRGSVRPTAAQGFLPGDEWVNTAP